ncbi:MAG: hypothetical protein B7C54_03910 [Acidimicrobiales bacterium mtb01]|nr:Hpt domain-containing protein [Actinomycetota bacterium]TEX46377.1 MAG: hypothetical protein B7C54_03910 [Acidimicrobiales bacterium mtb01]
MPNHERVEQELAALLRASRTTLIVQVDIIRGYRRGVVDRDRAREAAHRLAGTLGLFGFGELGLSASRIERDLESGAVSSGGSFDEFIERATDLLSD